MTIPRQPGGTFDVRRNTSRVFPPSAAAFSEARLTCNKWARENPEHLRWLQDGHPALTEAEHASRFGGPYVNRKSRSRRTPDIS